MSRLAVAILSLFVISLGYGVVVPVLPALAGGRDATHEGALSAVLAAYSAARIACQIPGGLFADRAGPVAALRLALPLFALSLVGFLFFTDLRLFVALRIVEGAATGLVYPACFALALRAGDPSQGGRRLSLLAALGTSGLLVGPALAALSPDSPRLPVAGALAASALLALWVWRPGAARDDLAAPAAARTVRDDLRALAYLARRVAFLGLMAPIAFNKLTFSAFQGLLPLVGADRWPGEPWRVTVLFVLTGLVFAAAQPLAGRLSDHLPPRRVVALAVPFLLLSLATLSGALGPVSFATAFGAYILFSSLIFTATMRHAARTFGTEDTYGGVFGLLATLTDLATVVGPLIFINLYGTFRESAFLAMAGIGAVFALFHHRFAPRVSSP